MSPARLILFAITALFAASVSSTRVSAADAAPEPTGIVFLHLRLLTNDAELISFEVTPGRLKPGPQHAGDRIMLVVQSAAGTPLWRGSFDDPRTQVIEYVDEQGQPARKVIEQSAPEIMARVPFFENGQVVRVARAAAGAAAANEKLLGTFQLTR